MEHLASHTLRHHSGHVILHRDKPGASFMAQEETLMYNEKGQLVGNRRGNLDGTCKIRNRRNVRMSPLTNYAMRDHCFLGEGYNFMPCYVMLCYVIYVMSSCYVQYEKPAKGVDIKYGGRGWKS